MVQYAGLLAGCSGHLCHHRRTDHGSDDYLVRRRRCHCIDCSFIRRGLEIQIGLFFVVSIILLFSTRKLFVKKLHTGQEKTNVDALIGREAVVTSAIKPLEPGIIRLGSQDWTAICKAEDTVIAEGTRVQVTAIEGVKAVVVPLAE